MEKINPKATLIKEMGCKKYCFELILKLIVMAYELKIINMEEG